jgi:hypothetical protein
MKPEMLEKVARAVDEHLSMYPGDAELRRQARIMAATAMANAMNVRPEERERAYSAIDSERTYQDKRWGRVREKIGDDKMLTGSSTLGQGVGNRSLDEFVLYMEGYLRDLVHLASHTNDPAPKLEFVRKVTALGVACMEQHGAPMRKPT